MMLCVFVRVSNISTCCQSDLNVCLWCLMGWTVGGEGQTEVKCFSLTLSLSQQIEGIKKWRQTHTHTHTHTAAVCWRDIWSVWSVSDALRALINTPHPRPRSEEHTSELQSHL